MKIDHRHALQVDAWLASAAATGSSEQLVELLDLALTALWRRAHQMLGVVTLEAIGHRVMTDVSERFPALAAVTVDERGFGCQALRDLARDQPRDEVTAWLRLVVSAWLGLVGNLTAEVVTPQLHAELARVSFSDDVNKVVPRPGAPREDMDS